MHHEPTYALEGKNYVFYLKGAKVFETEEVSVLYDRSLNVLHKHGPPERVQQEYLRFRIAFGKDSELAEDLVVLTGRFDVEELNKLVNISGYVERFYATLQAKYELSSAKTADEVLTRIAKASRPQER
jgi:hypothetical protein